MVAIIGEDTPWSRLFELLFQPVYQVITVEFLASFSFHPRPPDFQPPPVGQPQPPSEVSFRLCGQEHAYSLRQFALLCGLYTVQEIDTPLYTEAIHQLDIDVLQAWWPRIGDGHFRSSARVSLIRDPLIRYLHRCIASSISGRGKSQEHCTSQDLFYLYCLLRGRPCDLAYCLAEYFSTYFHRQERGKIFGGAYITHIARYLGLIQIEPADLDPHHPGRLDRSTAYGMKIVGRFAPGRVLRFSTTRGVIWEPGPHDLVYDDVGPPVIHQAEGGEEPHPQPAPQPQQVDEPEDPPQQQPPQHPQRVYHAVRLPAHVMDQLQQIQDTTADIRQTQVQLAESVSQIQEGQALLMERVRWLIDLELANPRGGLPPRPPPP